MDEKRILLYTLCEFSSYPSGLCAASEPIDVGWREWDVKDQLLSYPCWKMNIPYTLLRSELKNQKWVECRFLMREPMSALLSIMKRWYRYGQEKRAFPLYITFRRKVDELGLESDISIRLLADWLAEKNLRPLFDPQVALLDPSKRLNLVGKLLTKELADTSLCGSDISVPDNSGSQGCSPLDRIDPVKHRPYFIPLLQKDYKLYERITGGALIGKDRGVREADRQVEKTASTEVGKVTAVESGKLSGWVARNALGKRNFLVLYIDGKRIHSQPIADEEKSGRKRVRIKFLIDGVRITPKDKVRLLLIPGRKALPFSRKAESFFKRRKK
jgi:hypothetical protein